MDMLRHLFNVLLVFCAILVPSSYAVAASSGSTTAYFEIPTPFVVNLANDGDITFLQVNAQLKVARPELKTVLSAHMPAIQHTMMMLLSEQRSSDVLSLQGKQILRETSLKQLQALMQAQIGEPAVEEVYFTGFIVQ